MGIRLQNFLIIDDSRNISNITGADISGLLSINNNSNSLASLTVEQQGSGNCLIVQDQSNDTTPVVINGQGKMILGGSTIPSSISPNVIINGSTAQMSLKTGSINVNGVNGWSFTTELGKLHIVKNFSLDSERVMTFTTDNKVGIGTEFPLESLDIIGNMGIHTNLDANTLSGVVFAPALIDSLNHAIVSTDTLTPNYRRLDFQCSAFRIYTGDANGSEASTAFTISSTGVASFNKAGGGIVSAANFETDTGKDWKLLSSVTVNNAAAEIDLVLPSGYRNFSVILENIGITDVNLLTVRLLDSANNNISANTYRWGGLSGYSSTTLGINGAVNNTASVWAFGVANINASSVGGTWTGILTFYEPRSSNLWKRMTARGVHFGVVDFGSGPQGTECNVSMSGDVSSATVAEKLRFAPNTGTFTGGRMHLYGLRS